MIKLPLSVGDTILVGKYRNSPFVISGFEKDELNQPLISNNKGKKIKMLTFRIQSILPSAEIMKKISLRKKADKEKKKAEKEAKAKLKKEDYTMKLMDVLKEDIDMTTIQMGDNTYEIGFDGGNLVVATDGDNKVFVNDDLLSLMNTLKSIIAKEYEVSDNVGDDRIVNNVMSNMI